jgi:hypothetical protein
VPQQARKKRPKHPVLPVVKGAKATPNDFVALADTIGGTMNICTALMLLVLLAADANAQTWVETGAGEWEADESILESASFELSSSFFEASKSRLADIPSWASYTLKYEEYIDGDVRLLKITGTCDEYVPTEVDGEEIVVTADGGPCHFDAVYDVAGNKVVYFFLHGYD